MKWLSTLNCIDIAMKGFITTSPQIRSSTLTATRSHLSCLAVRRQCTLSPTDAARHLKFIIQQEFKTGCQDKPGFSTTLKELVHASDIQLSEVSLRTVERYSQCTLHDRQVVLRALLQQRLSAVLAWPPDAHTSAVNQASNRSTVSVTAQQVGLTGRSTSNSQSDVDQSATCSDLEGQEESSPGVSQAAQGSRSVHQRTWSRTWQGADHTQTLQWQSSMQDAGDLLQPARGTEQHMHDLHQQSAAGDGHRSSSRAGNSQAHESSHRASAGADQAGHGGSVYARHNVQNATDSASSSPRKADPVAAAATAAIWGQHAQHPTRAMICAHPTASLPGAPATSRRRGPVDTPHNYAVEPEWLQESQRRPQVPGINTPQQIPSAAQWASLQQNGSAHSHYSQQVEPYAVSSHSTAASTPPPMPSSRSSQSASHRAQSSAAVGHGTNRTAQYSPSPHTPGFKHSRSVVSSAGPPAGGNGVQRVGCEDTLSRACLPFGDQSATWYCAQLFGLEHGSADPLTPLISRAEGGYTRPGRSLLQVGLPEPSVVDYCLPSLLPEEADFIRGVEQRLKAAEYDAQHVVPIFWDTETTGLSRIEWWDRTTDRIVQLAALTAPSHGGLRFKRDLNPYPVTMNPGATKVTNLSTQKVWASDIVPQVGLAEFLDFCLTASEANGNALPMLVAHNSSFDTNSLLNNTWQAGIQVPFEWLTLCTHALSRRVAPDLDVKTFKLGELVKHFGSTVTEAQLHDAMEDAQQLPDLTDALERLGGPQLSVSPVAASTFTASHGATTFEKIARKRRVKVAERLPNATAPAPKTSPTVSERGRHRPAGEAGRPTSTASKRSSSSSRAGKAADQRASVQDAAATESPAPVDDGSGRERHAILFGDSSPPDLGLQAGKGAASGAAEQRSPAGALAQHSVVSAVDQEDAVADEESPPSIAVFGSRDYDGDDDLLKEDKGPDCGAQEGSNSDDSADEQEPAHRLSVSASCLDYIMAAEHDDGKDPFLTAWPKGTADSSKIELFSGRLFQREDVECAWKPFMLPLEEAGLPRKTFRSPLLSKLNAAGFRNILDIVRHTPRRERKDYPSVHIEELSGKVSVKGSIVSVGRPTSRPTCSFLTFSCSLNLLADDGTVVERPFDASIFTGRGYKGMYKLEKDAQRLHMAEANDALVVLVGRFKEDRKRGEGYYNFQVTEFDVVDGRAGVAEVAQGDQEDDAALAVYPSRRGISHADFSRYIPLVLEHLEDTLLPAAVHAEATDVPHGDFLPEWVLKEYKIMPWLQALAVAHAGLGSEQPAADRKQARRRLVFNECILLSLMMLHHRIAAQLSDRTDMAPVVCQNKARVETALAALPYPLTGAQQRVLGEILEDMGAPVPMLRLLQGDVGSGKTAVIFLAALAAISSGHQVAILVPNDVLATQHDTFIRKVSQSMPEEHQPVVEVLAGRVGVKRRREVRERLAAGDVDIIIGTTALNNPQEIFSSLGLVVIDEQHRFGVKQRANLVKKNPDAAPPHVLFATATPIPRTVAMTHMSHMTTSMIDELPPGRLPVETSIVKIKTGSVVGDSTRARQQVLDRVAEELRQGGSVFWVFPLVEDSEHFQELGSAHEASKLLKAQGGLIAEQAVVITGRMSSESKALALDAFRAGHCRLLVSTVVIEVGIDVPAATLMIVEHAERFGLLQLHQLRGRVGRSDKPSSCLLVTSSQGALPRLQVLEEHSCGKDVAEKDLMLRGAGQLFGQRQSGSAEMGLGPLLLATDLAADEEVVSDARAAAAALTRKYGFEELPPALLAALSGYNMTSLLALKMQDIDIHM